MGLEIVTAVAAIIAAIAAILSLLELKKEKLSKDYLHEASVKPGVANYATIEFPRNASKVVIERFSLILENAEPEHFGLTMLSNPEDFRKIAEISRRDRRVREGELEGKLYFPYLKLKDLKDHPKCEIIEWSDVDKRYRISVNVNMVLFESKYYLLFHNDSTSDQEVKVKMILTQTVEITSLSKYKAKILKFLKRE